ncbi:MAG: septal ring lytic transglycosylase RlpA family protein [Bacteroidia bacterium]|nr:septal ring lytic transglycosylase RlpA family protein [Bacteroidia bacterium]MBP9689120.1 septal ring lytic transglycosylase RlpA family protein [Bacteroidia bacterium]
MFYQIKYKFSILFLLIAVFIGSVEAQTNDSLPELSNYNKLDSASLAPFKVFRQRGVASYYAKKFNGRRTASGERYSPRKLTAAHRTLPFGTMVRVTDLKTGKWLIVRINDRGPYRSKRIIDLSYEAARQLGITKGAGLLKVKIRVVEWPEGYQ